MGLTWRNVTLRWREWQVSRCSYFTDTIYSCLVESEMIMSWNFRSFMYTHNFITKRQRFSCTKYLANIFYRFGFSTESRLLWAYSPFRFNTRLTLWTLNFRVFALFMVLIKYHFSHKSSVLLIRHHQDFQDRNEPHKLLSFLSSHHFDRQSNFYLSNLRSIKMFKSSNIN